ncbi:MAG: OmpA family protein [Chitinivibrionales bacterium]|nr:OmpA family protein [Chitinivibrionales bacterium]
MIKRRLIHRIFPVIFVYGLLTVCLSDGLPGEFLLSSRWRDLMGRYSPLTNPALLTESDYITLRGAFAPVMQGAFKLWEFGVTMPVTTGQTAGISIIGENDGEIQSARFDPGTERLVTGGSSSSNNNTFTMLSYAINPWRTLSLGANLNIAYQSNFGDPLCGLGLDIGGSYRFKEHPLLGEHVAGLSTINLIAPTMGRSLFDFDSDAAYSRSLRVSWLGYFWEQRLESGLDIDLKDLWANKNEFNSLDNAIKTAKKIEWGAAWRMGAWLKQTLGAYFQLGFDKRFIEYWGLAGGAKVPLTETGPKVTMLYQYNLKTEGDLASTHTFYLIMELGKKKRDEEAPKIIERFISERKVEKKEKQKQQPDLSGLKDIEGLEIEEHEKYVTITAQELAIHFASGSAELPPEGIKVLKRIADFLKTYPDHPVRIEGHTDSDPIVGKLKSVYPDNTALSRARARRVMKYFIETENLPTELFDAAGFGDSVPIAPNTTKEGKRKNRRVVITIMK